MFTNIKNGLNQVWGWLKTENGMITLVVVAICTISLWSVWYFRNEIKSLVGWEEKGGSR
jgi:hypothetical protein